MFVRKSRGGAEDRAWTGRRGQARPRVPRFGPTPRGRQVSSPPREPPLRGSNGGSMNSSCRTSLCALSLVCAAPARAQEAKATFDSAVVTLDSLDTPYELALDFDGDGDQDVLGMDKFYDYHSRAAHELALYANQGNGKLA